MEQYQQAFLEFAIERKVLKFGEFQLKSGRTSPYFFNAGLFNTGAALAKLGRFYAAALKQSQVPYDVIFGPAYKGIPIASATAIALYEEYGQDIPYVFNRKEAKAHGEGGQLVGAELKGRTLIVDDVITAGTAIRETMALLKNYDTQASGVLVALDRQEKGEGELTAIQEVEQKFGIPVISIVNLDLLIGFLELNHKKNTEWQRALCKIKEYQELYGA